LRVKNAAVSDRTADYFDPELAMSISWRAIVRARAGVAHQWGKALHLVAQ
jgi:hypothetical protein